MLTIRLLGPPAIERDGLLLRSPRGRKGWALLSYLLFGDADDPLGALRWTLAELRRSLAISGAGERRSGRDGARRGGSCRS
jgi:hypothetical protein